MIFKKLIFSLVLLSISRGQLKAEIVPDTSLPNDTKVDVQDNIILIEEGTARGTNLFHSFREFSFEGGEVRFVHSEAIANIFSRVTGGKVSEINGLISTSGAANLFLINPNGIMFGNNAALNIGGSFYATTADRVDFADGYSFFALPEQTEALLTITAPIGLGIVNQNSKISIRGNLNDAGTDIYRLSPINFNNSNPNLEVNTEQLISISANNIEFDSGFIAGGSISLTAIDSGNLNLLPAHNNFIPSVEQAEGGLIVLLNKSIVLNNIDALSQNKNQFINLYANDIIISDGSVIVSKNYSYNNESQINIEAKNSLQISNFSYSPQEQSILLSGINSEHISNQGKGADINIISGQINLDNLSSIFSSNYLESGTAGTINIEADSLSLTNASTIITQTNDGSGGDINIDSSSVLVEGYSEFLPAVASAIGSSIGPLSKFSQAGGVRINSDSIVIKQGGLIGTNAIGVGVLKEVYLTTNLLKLQSSSPTYRSRIISSGSLIDTQLVIEAEQIDILENSDIAVDSYGDNNSGSLFISANNLNLVGGTITGTTLDINRLNNLVERLFDLGPISLPEVEINIPDFRGQGGNIFIEADNIYLSEGSIIKADNQGIANAGSINIKTNYLNLDNSQISSSTLVGDGGEININGNILTITSDSQIMATAQNSGSGGNIDINTDITLLKQSQILARAEAGDGGNITINTQGLFSENTIFDASSQFSTDGTINLNIELSEAELAFEIPSFDLQEVAIAPCQPKVGSNFEIQGQSTPIQGLQQDYSVAKPQIAPVSEATAMEIRPDGRIFLTRPVPVNHNVAMACDHE